MSISRLTPPNIVLDLSEEDPTAAHRGLERPEEREVDLFDNWGDGDEKWTPPATTTAP